MINFFSRSKNNFEIKRLGKYILPVCFFILVILYAGTKPEGRNAARANAKEAESVEERIVEIVNSGQLSVDCGQRLDGMLVLVESRLIELDNLDVDEGEPCIIMMSYDYKGRRISKQVYVMGECDNYPLARVHSYVYDDWNLILETITNADNTTQEIQYFWGNDLSRTLNGAGGVGGLIAVSIDGYYYIPSYDNNGNVLYYINEQGQVVASYKYDAFGNTLEQTGSMSTAFNHRFSTKYCDDETGHYYYGYRFYSPVLGRWLNRDPIEEDGGLNLYAFLENSPISNIDYLGQTKYWDNYPNYAKFPYSPKVWKDVGGNLYWDHLIHTGTAYYNSCALRVSMALVNSGEHLLAGSVRNRNVDFKAPRDASRFSYSVRKGELLKAQVPGARYVISARHIPTLLNEVLNIRPIPWKSKDEANRFAACLRKNNGEAFFVADGHVGMIKAGYIADDNFPYSDTGYIWITDKGRLKK